MTSVNPPQNSDRLTLDETLQAMERLGRPGEYQIGYEDGFLGDDDLGAQNAGAAAKRLSYRRGKIAGRAAYWRGAHGYGGEVSS